MTGAVLPTGYWSAILLISVVSAKLNGFNLTETPDFGNVVVKTPFSSGWCCVFLMFNSSNTTVCEKGLLVLGSVTDILYSGPNEVLRKKIRIASISPSNNSSGLKSCS